MSKPDTAKSAGGWRLPMFGKGRSPLLSRNVNDLVLCLNALGKMRINFDPGLTEPQVVYSDGGIAFVLPSPNAEDTGVASQIKVVKIVSAPAESDSDISCIELEAGVETGSPFSVAKPPLLRGLSGNQYTLQPYAEDDLLLAMFVPDGLGTSTEWQDLNVDGRAIARETKGCDEDGNPVYAKVVRDEWSDTPTGADFT